MIKVLCNNELICLSCGIEEATNFIFANAEFDCYEFWMHVSEGNEERYTFYKDDEYRLYRLIIQEN